MKAPEGLDVKKFQKFHGLAVDGVYGPKTHAALMKSQQEDVENGKKVDEAIARKRDEANQNYEIEKTVHDSVRIVNDKEADKQDFKKTGIFPIRESVWKK